jgi:hypothetical protein
VAQTIAAAASKPIAGRRQIVFVIGPYRFNGAAVEMPPCEESPDISALKAKVGNVKAAMRRSPRGRKLTIAGMLEVAPFVLRSLATIE